MSLPNIREKWASEKVLEINTSEVKIDYLYVNFVVMPDPSCLGSIETKPVSKR